MAKTTVKVANTSLMALLDKVDQGSEVTIERDGQAVALLISANSTKHSFTKNHAVKTVDDHGFQKLCDAYASAV